MVSQKALPPCSLFQRGYIRHVSCLWKSFPYQHCAPNGNQLGSWICIWAAVQGPINQKIHPLHS